MDYQGKNQGKRRPGLMSGLRGKALKKKKETEPEVMVIKMVEEGPANKHKSMKFQKMKKTTNSDGNIEFVELKAKGGRAGYSVGGKAIKGVSKILIK